VGYLEKLSLTKKAHEESYDREWVKTETIVFVVSGLGFLQKLKNLENKKLNKNYNFDCFLVSWNIHPDVLLLP